MILYIDTDDDANMLVEIISISLKKFVLMFRFCTNIKYVHISQLKQNGGLLKKTNVEIVFFCQNCLKKKVYYFKMLMFQRLV